MKVNTATLMEIQDMNFIRRNNMKITIDIGKICGLCAIQAVLFILKYMGVITWSWWLVLLPFETAAVAWLFMGVVVIFWKLKGKF